MWSRLVVVVFLAAAAAVVTSLGLASASGVQPQDAAQPARVRIGVYDSRAIAIAYAASGFNAVNAKLREMEEAQAAGDQDRIAELKAWGEKHQRQLHRQGFARVPVSDLLEHVADSLPEVAEKVGVAAIVFDCNYLSRDVEKVDVTLDLVALFNPTERTMHWITESLKSDPIDLDEVEAGRGH